jgi:hypothetical protein
LNPPATQGVGGIGRRPFKHISEGAQPIWYSGPAENTRYHKWKLYGPSGKLAISIELLKRGNPQSDATEWASMYDHKRKPCCPSRKPFFQITKAKTQKT